MSKLSAAEELAKRLLGDPEKYVRGDMYRKMAPGERVSALSGKGITSTRHATPDSPTGRKEYLDLQQGLSKFRANVYAKDTLDDPASHIRPEESKGDHEFGWLVDSLPGRDVAVIDASESSRHAGGGQRLYDAMYDTLQDEDIANLVQTLTLNNSQRHPINNMRQMLRTGGEWSKLAIPTYDYVASPTLEMAKTPTGRLATLIDTAEQRALQRLDSASTGHQNRMNHWQGVVASPDSEDKYRGMAEVFMESFQPPEKVRAALYDPNVPLTEAVGGLRQMGMQQVGPTTAALLRALQGVRQGDDRLLRGLEKNLRKGGLVAVRGASAHRSNKPCGKCPCGD